jgi:hypothetical protein
MVSVLALSAVDHGFKSRLGQTKDYKILVFVVSLLSTQHFRVIAYIIAIFGQAMFQVRSLSSIYLGNKNWPIFAKMLQETGIL